VEAILKVYSSSSTEKFVNSFFEKQYPFVFPGDGEIDFQEFLCLMTNTERFLERLGYGKL